MKCFTLRVLPVGLALAAMMALPVHAYGKVDEMVGANALPRGATNARPFSDSEVRQFLKGARRAEAISDPLQRCLAYPDPPGSHWSRAATRVYCKYRMVSIMDFDHAKALIEDGRASELDAYLERSLEKQLTKPDSVGLLDHIYLTQLSRDTAEARAMIDFWKRQSPVSAFALAASGRSYLGMAWRARGGSYVDDTPSENFVAMHKWLKLASEDLNKAVAIDPRVLPAYSTMINIGMLNGDEDYAEQAAAKGLAIQPSNYSIYRQLVWMAEPKWEGSIDDMRRIVGQAQAHAKDNAMLQLLLPLPAAYDANLTDCNCSVPADPNAYRNILDQMPAGDILGEVAEAVDSDNRTNLAIVYLSEVFRFNPLNTFYRAQRIRHLVTFGESTWASTEAADISAKPLIDAETMKALATGYVSLGDVEGVRKINSRLSALP